MSDSPAPDPTADPVAPCPLVSRIRGDAGGREDAREREEASDFRLPALPMRPWRRRRGTREGGGEGEEGEGGGWKREERWRVRRREERGRRGGRR